jgi:ABC-type transport system involved in multi-copper enzyme maturation permease subunit
MKVVAAIVAFVIAYLVSGLVVTCVVVLFGGEVNGVGATLLVIAWLVGGILLCRGIYRFLVRSVLP